MNQVTLIGRITQELEIKTVGNDRSLLSFSIAVNERWSTGEHTSFFDVESWGKQAEIVAQYFKKGQRIGVTGTLRQDRYEARDGSGKRSRVKIVLRDFTFIEPKGYVPTGGGGYDSAGGGDPMGGGGGAPRGGDPFPGGGAPAPGGADSAPGEYDENDYQF